MCTDITNTETCVSTLEFGLIDFMLETPYGYSGALGLGLVQSDYLSSGGNYSSFVERWAQEQSMLPQVIIDSNFAGDDSYVWFGTDPIANTRNLLGSATSSLTDRWSLEVDTVSVDGR